MMDEDSDPEGDFDVEIEGYVVENLVSVSKTIFLYN